MDYLDLFALDKEELTLADVEPFRIDLSNLEPHSEKFLRYNPILTKYIDKEVDGLLT